MKKSMFENSDLIVALPGGIGTLSEILSFVEENRSNDKDIPIIIYDENYFYHKLLELFSGMSVHGFITEDLSDYIKVAHNRDELRELVDNCMMKGRVK